MDNSDDYTRRELLDTLKEYHKEIVDLMDRSHDEVEALKTATSSFNNNKQEPFWKKSIIGAIIVVAIIFVLMLLAMLTNHCKVSVSTEGAGFERCK